MHTPETVQQTYIERKQMYTDFYNNVIPKRAIVTASLSPQMTAEYHGVSPIDCQYDFAKVLPYVDNVCQKLYSDTFPVQIPLPVLSRPAAPFQLLGSTVYKMGAKGYVQHPETAVMREDEYDEFIDKGFDFIVEKTIPRMNKNLDTNDPVKMAYTIQMVENFNMDQLMSYFQVMGRYNHTYGYHLGAPQGSTGIALAPCDYLADNMRGFSGFSKDIRRMRDKVKAAVEVITPIIFNWGLPAHPHPEGSVFFPLHMPTFMREKDFIELWLPSFKAVTQQYAARGIRCNICLEDDWTRYLDIIHDEFPAGSVLRIEKGDPKLFKDKLGKKFILADMFPIKYAKNYSQEEMIDEAKRFLDIMLPGGGYLFGFDKSPLMACDIEFGKYCALMEFVHDYAVYDNAGEAYGTKLNSEGFEIIPEFGKDMSSKYFFDWEQFKSAYPMAPDFAKEKFEVADAKVFASLMNL